MKRIFLFVIFFILNLALVAQNTNTEAAKIKKQMATIRQSTNWGNEEEAKVAYTKIAELSKQLMMIKAKQQAQENGKPIDAQTNELIEKGVEYKMQVWGQIQKSAAAGEGADVLLAKPLREDIVEAYKEEDTRKPVPLMTDNLDVLMIDMSLKGIKALIDNMSLFKSITKLIITSSEPNVPVDLSYILRNAAAYPLKELYIINFGVYVTELPSEISRFDSINILGIFNNNIAAIPKVIADFKVLREVYIDNNPLATTFPVISQLSNLEVLGLMNTKVSEKEISTLKEMYPACKILTE